jgi:nucleotide-binding universal stress UspA family protein
VLIRPEAASDAGKHPPPFRRLLLPLDGKASTAIALAPAVRLARQLGCALDLLHVVYAGQRHPGQSGIATPRYVDQPDLEWPGWADEARSWLRAWCRNGVTDVPTEVHVRGVSNQEGVGPTIAAFAAELRSDAIILVRHSNLWPRREPVARSVLDLAPCPVLLVPGRRTRERSSKAA